MNDICPLIQRPCMKGDCAWFAKGIEKCAVVAIGLINEKIHDLSVAAYQAYVESPAENETHNNLDS